MPISSPRDANRIPAIVGVSSTDGVTPVVPYVDPTTHRLYVTSGAAGSYATTALDNLASVAINAALVLGTSDAFALGSAAKQWSDLFLAEGGVINWDNGDVTLTQTGNLLAVAGGDFAVNGGQSIRFDNASNNANAYIYNNGASGLNALTITNFGSASIIVNDNTVVIAGNTTARIQPRVVSMADATSFTPTGDTADQNTQANTQAVGTLTANAPTGTPTDGQKLIIRIKSTNVQTFSWNAIYRGSNTVALPTATTGSSKTDYFAFIYNSADSKWDCVSASYGYT